MSFLKIIWKNNSKHKKLSEELALQNVKENDSDCTNENENDVATFKLKYLGSTVVEKLTGNNISVEAVKNIIKSTKASRKKLQQVIIAISLKGIVVSDLQGNDLFKISIYRISNCSTNPTHRQVFSFISTDQSETMECHAFLCNKRKITETVTLTVAHAFSTAYEAWKILPTTKDSDKKIQNNNNNNNNGNSRTLIQLDNGKHVVEEEKLIDFSDDDNEINCPKPVYELNNQRWVSFDDDCSNAFPKNDYKFA